MVSLLDAKCLNYFDPAYAAYAAYPYGDYSSAYPGIDAYGYNPYYGCFDYFSSQGNPNPAAGNYSKYLRRLNVFLVTLTSCFNRVK